MSLSNTATPKYYGEFREAVLAGKIPVNYEVSLQMNRIDELIANPGVYYDDKITEGFIDFVQSEMVLRDGSDATVLPSFKLWAEDVLSWYYFEEKDVPIPDARTNGIKIVRMRIKKRLRNKQYLIVGRGAAKSMYASYMQTWFLTCDPSTTQQITVAPTMEMADEVLAPIRTAISRARGPYFKFLTQGSLQNTSGNSANRPKLYSSKKGIENKLTESIIKPKPLSIDKLQGLNVKMATLDEWRSGEIREDPITAIEQGAAKVKDYLIIAISSEGTVRNGVGDTIGIELMDILKGDYNDPHTSIWWYKLDSIEEVGDPNVWSKANPNLGYTVSYETYQREVEKAEKEPAVRNEILAKRFGLPMEGFTYFFTYDETLPTLPVPNSMRFNGLPCAMGADLSRGDDFCAFTFLFPLKNGTFGIDTINYISENTLYNLTTAMRLKYNEFMNEESLRVMPGTVLDMIQVYDDLNSYISDHEYVVNAVGYDPYNAKEFIDQWSSENGSFGIEKVIQGRKTESVPLGEIKKMAEKRMFMFYKDIITFSMGNCIVMVDINGNRQLQKRRNDEKIDPIAALMDAWVAYKRFKEAF